jgi:hypothetical protein
MGLTVLSMTSTQAFARQSHSSPIPQRLPTSPELIIFAESFESQYLQCPNLFLDNVSQGLPSYGHLFHSIF